MASAGAAKGGEVMYDQRLFNQEKGGLFTAQPTLSTLYKPKKDVDSEMYGGADEQMDKIMKTDRFKPDKVKKGKKADRGGGGGTMRASGGGSSNRDNYDGGSGRSRIGFERGH
ncbi:SNW/SKI-interacting protein A [Linum perenne]